MDTLHLDRPAFDNAFSEVRLHHFATEASILALPPGVFPRRVVVKGLGNGQPLLRSNLNAERATYKQALGIVSLVIFND